MKQQEGLRPHCTMLLKWTVIIAVSATCLYSSSSFWCTCLSSEVPRGVPWKLPRPLQQQHTAVTPALTADSFWEQQAQANLSRFRSSIVETVRPYYNKQKFWSVFVPVITCPPRRPLKRYGGTNDGSKLLCDVKTDKMQQEGCVIYSMGSNGNYDFEQAMLKATRCQIHTFDCTYATGTSQNQTRHHYHHWCAGDPAHGEQYRTWDNITASLGRKAVDLLKIDIEGYEHEVLPTWKTGSVLPDELSIEFHVAAGELFSGWPGTTAELGLTFLLLANLGYAAYSQEVNAGAPHCCSEFTFLRLAGTT